MQNTYMLFCNYSFHPINNACLKRQQTSNINFFSLDRSGNKFQILIKY